ncbi:TOBE domain-containing protein [Nocardia arthritidis]|uniref:Helix-turn-helix domain-containing protein n=1 Tax=Nocardia arthritidis TaxID=228602 RepID=A0A6G9YVL1_9NOCA|nr:helix-turn-helix transcriptional regulator [Nocardia arthritidis]QIS16863.1 helix-turn-helix domain-containing protein [Nocardia arthritidis]
MATLRIRDAAELLGVSDDSVRRWIDAGALTATKDSSGRLVIDGKELAALAVEQARTPRARLGSASSARNRFPGLVTRVVTDTVMAQVEMQCGPFTVVSLMSADAVRELGLEPGSVAMASVKATTVVVETAAE